MADSFDSIESGKGLLKPAYDTTPIGDALKKKREKLADTKGIGESSKEEE